MLTVKDLMGELQRLMDADEIKSDTPIALFNHNEEIHESLSFITAEIHNDIRNKKFFLVVSLEGGYDINYA